MGTASRTTTGSRTEAHKACVWTTAVRTSSVVPESEAVTVTVSSATTCPSTKCSATVNGIVTVRAMGCTAPGPSVTLDGVTYRVAGLAGEARGTAPTLAEMLGG
mgnify:CR=1 FL=1